MTGKQPNKMQVPAAAQTACGRCGGHGWLAGRNGQKVACYDCRGTGKVASPNYRTKG
jgi:DnaJ-class molecular chaperone